jgi:NifB/MoaA-like Fe-S oxidoreductase
VRILKEDKRIRRIRRMAKKDVLKESLLLLTISALLMFPFKTAFSGESSSNSCLDCHISLEKLKKITTELEKKKPAKSSEISGEG